MKSSKIKLLSILIIAGLITNCAKHPDKIAPSYVSPMQYENYTCSQLSAEMQRVSVHVSDLAGKQAKQASNDKVKTGVGLILFWPTLFFLDGDSPQATEYARLKGEFNALEQTGIKKNCGIKVELPKPVKEEQPKELVKHNK